MKRNERSFQDLSLEEKLDFIERCIDVLNDIAGEEKTDTRKEWLRHYIPAYDNKDGKNYIFVSYSHSDYKDVYKDLAFFSYNTKKKVRFWYDEGLPPGEEWFKIAEKQIRDPNCVGVIFYLSENFLRSSAVLQEIELVKSTNKPHFTITLDEGKHCAEDYLNKEGDAEILSKLNDVFPRVITTISPGNAPKEITSDILPETYSGKHEDALYRVDKIEKSFSVVENVYSDFVFEEVEDGLSLAKYTGNTNEVYIPERVRGKNVVEIKASFDTAHRIYVPQTVRRILPVTIQGYSYPTIKNSGIDDLVRITETLFEAENCKTPQTHSPQVLFGNAESLKYIDVSKNNPVFYDKDGVLYSGDTLLRYPPAMLWDNKYLEGVRVIGTGAVFNHHERELPDFPDTPPTVPETVEEIGDHAFSSCTFWDIDIREGVKKIGNGAFAGASCIETQPLPLIIPESVTHIGESAFKGCAFPTITILSRLDTIPNGLFLGFSGNKIVFKHPVNGVEKRAFAHCINLDTLLIPKISGRIGEYAFTCCKKLKKMHLSPNVTDICDNAFSFCSELSEITISDGVKRIEHNAFKACSSLRSVSLPNSLDFLSPSSFDDCESLLCVFYNGKRYEELAERSGLYEGFMDPFSGGAFTGDPLVFKIVLKNQRFERLKLSTILKLGDIFKKHEKNND